MAWDAPKVFGENKLNPICLSWDMDVRLGPFGQKDYWKCYCECVTPSFEDIPFIVGNAKRVLLRREDFTSNIKVLQPVLLHK